MGIALALGGIVAGLLLEGGNLRQVLQPTAAMIVFGGTLGAVMLQFPTSVLLVAIRRLGTVFRSPKTDAHSTVQRLVQYAQKARREGIVSLDAELPAIHDAFLKKSLMLAVDGTEPDELRKIMELELNNQAEYEDQVPQVFESAGGFAVAFVATIYGVGSANLLYLPISGKMKLRIREEQITREMTLEGVASILEGMNPHMLETKLLGFLVDAEKRPEKSSEEQRL
jgi:chemotaxis protein MotA